MIDWYKLDIETPATEWGVTDAEIKNFIKLPDGITADDTLITDVKKAATRKAERWMNRTIVTTEWKMTLDSQPNVIDFPLGYLQSISDVLVYAESGTTTSQSGKYHTQTGEDGRIWLKVGQSWTTTTREKQLMEITFTTGYLTAENSHPVVPKDIKLGLLAWCYHLYFHRDSDEIPAAARRYLLSHKIYLK